MRSQLLAYSSYVTANGRGALPLPDMLCLPFHDPLGSLYAEPKRLNRREVLAHHRVHD